MLAFHRHALHKMCFDIMYYSNDEHIGGLLVLCLTPPGIFKASLP